MPAVTRDGAKRPSKTGAAPAPRAGLHPRAALAAAGGVLALAVVLALATGGRAAHLVNLTETGAVTELAGAGFQVRSVELAGASRFSVPYILHAAGVRRGDPILGLDLGQIRERVERVGWVKSVRVLRLLPDTLVVAVSERPRLAVWQTGGHSYVVDPDGQVIPEADPGLFVDLPLIVGDGANQAAAAILPEIQTRPRLLSRLEALVRVDGRRWDLRLKDGSLIQLPAEGEDSALIQLDQLDQHDRLLDLGFQRIDLRDPEMIAVRPRQPAPGGPGTPLALPPAAATAATTPLAPQPPAAAHPSAAPPASGE